MSFLWTAIISFANSRSILSPERFDILSYIAFCSLLGSIGGVMPICQEPSRPAPSRTLDLGIGQVTHDRHCLDIDVVLALVSLDDPVSRKACGATVRMVNDDDLPDPEQMLRDRDGPKRIDSTAAGDDDRKNGRRRCHTIPARRVCRS